MQENKVVLTWEAIYDVTDITDYIEAEFGIARALLHLQETISSVNHFLYRKGTGKGSTYFEGTKRRK